MNTNEICLFYLDNRAPFADVSRYTYFGRILDSFINQQVTWYVLEQLTDQLGQPLLQPKIVNVTTPHIVSWLPLKKIAKQKFYTFLIQNRENYDLVATNFVNKSVIDWPLTKTSRTALGTGIFGVYQPSTTSSTYYQIELQQALILQDEAHGASLTLASLETNRYLDQALQVLRQVAEDNLITELYQWLKEHSLEAILNLWRIVFLRVQRDLTLAQLENILIKYLLSYLQSSLQDETGQAIDVLPVNEIMLSLGYQGVIADDYYNNGWDRGCLSYQYQLASRWLVKPASYTTALLS